MVILSDLVQAQLLGTHSWFVFFLPQHGADLLSQGSVHGLHAQRVCE